MTGAEADSAFGLRPSHEALLRLSRGRVGIGRSGPDRRRRTGGDEHNVSLNDDSVRSGHCGWTQARFMIGPARDPVYRSTESSSRTPIESGVNLRATPSWLAIRASVSSMALEA